MSVVEIIVSVLVVLATLLVVATAVALWRAPDALTRVNVLGPTTSVALPILLVAKVIHDASLGELDANDLVRAVIAIAGLWLIAAVGSYYIGRSIYGVTVVDERAGVDHRDVSTKQ
ncbi:Na+/H+ antiporter subunit G [Corynebacterium frankenforstense]|uniref:Na+/H+ antiporter subunit G n=1 Tax=Corynebacterium TaxID=1716 RepID=UPI00254D4989|nr:MULTISPECIES: Na+/H+ antiporter subunit G [Corynebacterium]MDK6260169.1 Na+/H+ antiporter subunit G [Corynebacterium frankenforstense]MDK8895963.1 Na+/H+ antiporter subunit G [Corynebacterium sp. MSK006]